MSNALGLKTWGEKIASQKKSLTELTEDAVVDDGYTALDGEIPFSKEQLEQTENVATAEDLHTEAQLSHAENKVPHTEPASHLEKDHSQVKTSPRDVIAEAHVNQKVDTDTVNTVNTVITFTPLPVEAADPEQVPEANWAPWDDEDEGGEGEATAMPVTVPGTENGDGGDSEAPRPAQAAAPAPKTSPPAWRKRRADEAWDPAEDSSGEEARTHGMRF